MVGQGAASQPSGPRHPRHRTATRASRRERLENWLTVLSSRGDICAVVPECAGTNQGTKAARHLLYELDIPKAARGLVVIKMNVKSTLKASTAALWVFRGSRRSLGLGLFSPTPCQEDRFRRCTAPAAGASRWRMNAKALIQERVLAPLEGNQLLH